MYVALVYAVFYQINGKIHITYSKINRTEITINMACTEGSSLRLDISNENNLSLNS